MEGPTEETRTSTVPVLAGVWGWAKRERSEGYPPSPEATALMHQLLHFGGGEFSMRLTDHVEDHACPVRHGSEQAGRQPRLQPMRRALDFWTLFN